MTAILLRCLRFRADVVWTAHGHDAHAVGAGVGFDDDERVVLDAVFFVFFRNFFNVASTALANSSSPRVRENPRL